MSNSTEVSSRIQRLEDNLVQLVYGSNYIEVTGSDFNVTEKICRKVFWGEEVEAVVEPRTEEYEEAKAALIALRRPDSHSDVVQSRQEIINHTKALKYAINHVVIGEKRITEDFLKKVHTQLCEGNVLGEDAGKPGEYRTWEVAARHGEDMKKRSIFIRASAVPAYMSSLVGDLEEETSLVGDARSIDPFDMASRYCHRFVCIHPFGDGNGRMCRILLNILLLKYAGHVALFGGTEEERQEYLDIARQANKKFHEEDMEVPEEEKKGHRQLAKFIQAKAVVPQSYQPVRSNPRPGDPSGAS
ncbi:Fic-domain-containing protein [Hypomontagnella submonticulosa]|nr:Fic-domain-containing protein [Hypomontagnella submonticulosa]